MLSTVDTEARYGHKSRARTFDGDKAYVATDPDDELITNVALSPANTPDRDAVDDLLDEPATVSPDTDTDTDGGSGARGVASNGPVTVFGDTAYADGATLDKLAEAGHEVFAKVPPVRTSKGYSKDEFSIDPEAGTVGCPAVHTTPIRPRRGGGGHARFRPWCAGCPLRTACTTTRSGRVITTTRTRHACSRPRPRNATRPGNRPTAPPVRSRNSRSQETILIVRPEQHAVGVQLAELVEKRHRLPATPGVPKMARCAAYRGVLDHRQDRGDTDPTYQEQVMGCGHEWERIARTADAQRAAGADRLVQLA